MSYVTSTEFKSWLGIQPQVENDPILPIILDAADQAIDDYTGRSFGAVSTSTSRIFVGGTHRTLIDDAQTVTLVEHSLDRVNWTTVAATDWSLDPANTVPKTTVASLYALLPWVRVTGTFGHATAVPSSVKLAVMMKAAKLWKRRDTPTGVEGFGDFGVVRISRSEDPDIVALLQPLVRADRSIGIA